MKKSIALAIFSLSFAVTTLAVAVTAQAQDATPGGGLPSPYFIDEVHCSGNFVRNVHEGWLLSQDEVEPARKVEEADMCERLLRVYGIVKYNWLSPDDLERTATLIRESGFFKDASLSIKKSELKNHVHVYLTVTPGPRFTEMVSNDFRFYDPVGQGSPRLYDHLTAEVTDRRAGPVALNTLGVDLRGTSAKSYFTTNSSLAPEDVSKLQMPNDYVADLYWKGSGEMRKGISYDIGFHLVSDNGYWDHMSRLNGVIDGDLLATRRIEFMNGSVFAGPAFVFTTYTPYQATGNNSDTGVFMPGGIVGYSYGQALGNHLTFKLAYYSSMRDQSIMQMNFDLSKKLHIIDYSLIFGFDQRIVQNAVLPQDHFPFDSGNDFNVFAGFSKTFRGDESTHQISAVVGAETLGYSVSQPQYEATSNYVGLKYKLLEGTWNINLAASYYFQRLY